MSIIERHPIDFPAECLLDKLFLAGYLGSEPSLVNRRLQAGLWLRELYHERAMLGRRMTMRYAEEDSRDDDLVEEARGIYRRVMRFLGGRGALVLGVCCHDSDIRFAQIPDLLTALDVLAAMEDRA